MEPFNLLFYNEVDKIDLNLQHTMQVFCRLGRICLAFDVT